jgi:N-sulfoglucosamine sulfohydrolase
MSERPNILLLISHDLGCHISPYGNAVEESPNLAAFAKQGMRLDSHFVTSPGCSQSRSSLVTGRYPHANGQFGLANFGWKIKRDEILMPAALKESGYRTAMIGVWHLHEWTLGAFDDISDDVSTLDTSPEGFSDVASDRASRWITEYDGDQPFYLHVGFWEVHRPFCGSEAEVARADAIPRDRVTIPPYLPQTEPTEREFAELHQSVGLVDGGVQRVLTALEDSGRAENTIVLFTADHGLPFPRAKGTLYDPGIQVSFLARWPGKIAPNQSSATLTSNADVMPTVLEAAGVGAPDSVQGTSFLGALTGDVDGGVSREFVFAEKTYHEHYDPIRSVRTQQFKYIRNFADRPKLVLPSDIYNSPTRASMDDDENIWGHRPEEELYDLKKDPLEHNNLAGVPLFGNERSRLSTVLREWMLETEDPLLDGPILRPAD